MLSCLSCQSNVCPQKSGRETLRMCDVSHFCFFSACCFSRLTCTFGAVFIPRLQSMVSLSLIMSLLDVSSITA